MATSQATTDQFLHGIEFISVDTGARPITTPRMNTVYIVGTAPKADKDAFPINKPVLIPGREADLVKLGLEGTLPTALKFLFKASVKQAPFVIVSRVEEGKDDNETMANFIGGIDDKTGEYTGVKTALTAEQETGVKPRILIAPGHSHNKPVVDALEGACDQLRAINWVDAPCGDGTTYKDAINYRKKFNNRRTNIVYPDVSVYDETAKKYITLPASIMAAGAECMTNYYDSSSMTSISAIQGLTKPVTFEEGNRNTITNLLNENGVTTFINQSGWKLYGNQNASDDSLWKYRAHVRLDDSIAEAIVHAHLWAKDRQIKRTYTDDVLRSLNNYLEYLSSSAVDAIAGGRAWLDPEVNQTVRTVNNGEITFDFDYGRYGYAEHISFRRFLNNNYVSEVLFK